MSINLSKGQKIDLTKGNAGLSKLVIGLGWDAVKQTKGFFNSMFGGGNQDIDCDASVFMLDKDDKLNGMDNLIYFGRLKSKCGAVIHQGDNRTGDGDGDDEQIIVELSKVNPEIHKLLFTVNIYDCLKRRQDFGMIQNAFIRVVNQANNTEILRYNLSENYAGKTALLVGEIYRNNGEWKFAAIGEGTNDSSLTALIQKYKI